MPCVSAQRSCRLEAGRALLSLYVHACHLPTGTSSKHASCLRSCIVCMHCINFNAPRCEHYMKVMYSICAGVELCGGRARCERKHHIHVPDHHPGASIAVGEEAGI